MKKSWAAQMACAGVLACVSSGANAQPSLLCARAGTGQTWCVDFNAVSGSTGTRFAPLYQGNDRVAHPTRYVARADCPAQRLEFLDAGRPFWAAHFGQSALADRLGAAMCE